MTKIERVEQHLRKKGWIDGTGIRKITNTTNARDYICDLKRRKKVSIISHHVTPTYTRWLLGKGSYVTR